MILKIMFFLDEAQGVGGAARTLLRQAVLMKKAGHEVLLSVSNYKNEKMAEEYSELCKKSDIEICCLPFQVSSQPENIDIVSVINHYDIIKDAIRKYDPDLLHSIQINSVVELVSRELKIPHIMNIYQIKEEFFSIPYTDIFPHYHICDSQYYADIWKAMLHTDSVCIRTAADKPVQKRRCDDLDRRVRYCCVGVLCERKNQLEVIKAFELALSAGLYGELFLYGYDIGPYAEECRHYLKERKLEESIHIVGFCTDMETEYEKADVLLCGSTCESYPNVISEALAHGLVVISTPVAGVPEVIRDGYNGYLCAGYTKTAICQKILQFDYEKKAGRTAEIRNHANDTYKKVHSPERVSFELTQYYLHVLEDTYEAPQIRIEDIREIFFNLIKRYENKREVFLSHELVSGKLWYIYHIKDILKKQMKEGKKTAYIWGAGRMAKTVKAMVEVFFPFLELEGFIDSYRQGKLLDLPVYHPGNILKREDVIFFVGLVNGQEEVLHILQGYSKIYDQDHFVLASRVW